MGPDSDGGRVTLGQLRATERWLAWVRVAGVPFAIFQVAIASDYPAGYENWAWLVTGIFALGTATLLVLSRRDFERTGQVVLGGAALIFDFAIVSAYILIYSFQQGSPIRQIMFLPIVEAALRYAIPGAVAVALASAPVMAPRVKPAALVPKLT